MSHLTFVLFLDSSSEPSHDAFGVKDNDNDNYELPISSKVGESSKNLVTQATKK